MFLGVCAAAAEWGCGRLCALLPLSGQVLRTGYPHPDGLHPGGAGGSKPGLPQPHQPHRPAQGAGARISLPQCAGTKRYLKKTS